MADKPKTVADLSPEERRDFYRKQMGHDEEFDKARIKDFKNAYRLTASNYLRGQNNPLGESGMYAGKIGNQEFMSSEDTNKLRKKAYDSKNEEYAKLGIPDMPIITDPYLNEVVTKANNDAINLMDLNELEKIVSEMSPQVKIGETPFAKAKKELDKKMEDYFVENSKEMKLSAKEEKILGAEMTYRGVLYNIYQKGAALKLTQEHYFDGENSYLEKFYEQFKPKEEEKSESKDEEKKE